MQQVKSRGWALASAVIAVAPIFAGPHYLLSLPMGTWALIVLSRPDVKAAFDVAQATRKNDG